MPFKQPTPRSARSTGPHIPAPDPALQEKIDARTDNTGDYLRVLLDLVNRVADEISSVRNTVATQAGDPQVTNEKVRRSVEKLTFLDGQYDGAKHLYSAAVGSVSHHDNLDLRSIHMLVWKDFMERWAQIAMDDAWSGSGNDDRRRYRDGFARAMQQATYMPGVPDLTY